MAARTFTIDTANSPWVYSDGEKTTVSGTAETFVLTFTDTGDGGTYVGGGESDIALANGDVLTIEQDGVFTFINHTANGALNNTGSIWVRINGGNREEVKVVSSNFADADGTGANNLAAITFEYPGKPYQWSWANVNMA